MNKRILAALAALVCLGALPQAAQNRASVQTRLTQGIVKLGAVVGLIVEVDGTDQAQIDELPKVAGLTIGPVSRPSRQFYQSLINGRFQSTTRVTWTVDVRPIGTGEFEIPPVVLRVDGQRIETRPQKLKVVEDLQGGDLGLFEITPSTRTVVEGQPFSIHIRFGFDATLSKRVNYANLSLPWWGAMPGTLELEQGITNRNRQTEVTLNGSETILVERRENELVRGREFVIFEVKQSLIPTRTGRLEFSGNVFEFGQLRGGTFFTRQSKAEAYYVVADEFGVDVIALPEDGRPFDFGGAIGSIDVRATTDTRDLTVGDSVKLTVEWFGEGNFEFFDAPDPARGDGFGDFRVYGSTEKSKGFDHRSVVYDLAPLTASVDEIPGVRLPVFDPETGEYLEVTTPAIPIRVRALEGARTLEGGAVEPAYERDIEDIQAALPSRTGRRDLPGIPNGVLAGALVLTPLSWLFVRTQVRRRLGNPDAPLERRRRRARRELGKALSRAQSPRDEFEAVLTFLGARSRESDSAWIGRDVADYLEERNGDAKLAPEDSRELSELLQELEASAFGEKPRSRDKATVLALADRLIGGGL